MSDWDWAANFALSKLDLRILFLLKTKSFFFFFLFYSSCARPVWPPKLVCKLETTFGAAQPPRPPPPDRRHKLFKLRQCRRRPRCRCRRRKLPRQSLDAPLLTRFSRRRRRRRRRNSVKPTSALLLEFHFRVTNFNFQPISYTALLQ